MTREETLREIAEARAAGNRSLASLRNAQDKLDSAGNWGVLDMLGGNLLSGLMKHSRLSEANEQMEQARRELRSFQDELQDVDMPSDFSDTVSDFLVFADFFFDGIIADWLVQSKIDSAKRQVDEAIEKVEAILRDLDAWERQL